MQPDQLSVLFADNGFGVTAHVYGPGTPPDRDITGPGQRYAHITRPLAQRGPETGVDFGADGYVREIRAMRGDLADRHTAHPGRTRPAPQVPAGDLDTRVLAALATSPTSTRTVTGHPAEAALAALATTVRAAGPRR